MPCVYACANSGHTEALRHIVFLVFCSWLSKDSRVTRCVIVFFMNSDKFRLIFGSDTESEEDYIFTGFSEQDLIMGDTNSSSKKHSKTKRMPTAPAYVQESVEATSQVEHCVRPCENQPKSNRKFLEEDGPK